MNDLVGSRFDYMLLNPAVIGSGAAYQTASVSTIFGFAAIGGGGLGCRRDLWDRLGGNDEQMLAEDTDFCIRAQLHAGVAPVLADAVYHCRLRESLRGEFRRSMRQAQSEVQIFKRYGSDAHRPSVTSTARRWVRVVTSLRGVKTRDGRIQSARLWGGAFGRVRGSITYQTRYL